MKTITTEEEYQSALMRIDVLMDVDPEPPSEEWRELNALVALVQSWEVSQLPETTRHEKAIKTLEFCLLFANGFEPDARLCGNVRADEMANALELAIEILRKEGQ